MAQGSRRNAGVAQKLVYLVPLPGEPVLRKREAGSITVNLRVAYGVIALHFLLLLKEGWPQYFVYQSIVKSDCGRGG